MTHYLNEYLSTGSLKLDTLLGGGISPGCLIQLYGGPGSGKTEICHTIAALARPEYKKLIINTGTKFRLDRIKVIAESRGLDVEKIMHNTLTAHALDTNGLEYYIKLAQAIIWSDCRIRLLIIDSIIDLFRTDESYQGQQKLPKRQYTLSIIMHQLSNIAVAKNVAVIITNQFFLGGFFMSSVIPTGGNLMTLLSDYIIYLAKRSSFKDCTYSAILMKGQPESESHTDFKITRMGISDI